MTEFYKERIADKILAKRLKAKGAVLIEGPKWCGKTTTAEQTAKSVIRLDDPYQPYLQLADLSPAEVLNGPAPRLIDEWQLAPKLWDAIRFEVDHRRKMGQFILTGSSVPEATDSIHHSGTGRFGWLRMRTMSLYESKESTGEVSLAEMFDRPESISGFKPVSLRDIAFLACRGGWPASIDMEEEIALAQAPDYLDAVIHQDLGRFKRVERDPDRTKRLFRAYARNQGSQASIATLKADMQSRIDESTLEKYLTALRNMFVIEDMPAWNPNLRSKTAIRTSDTRYFADPSIAAAALGIGPADLIDDPHTFGLLFETMAIRDLRVYADALNGTVYHYRDKTGLECDAVIHLRNGGYGLIEIKLGGEKAIEEGASALKKLSSKIDTEAMKSPSFLMVLVGIGDYAYRRADSVYVVPLSCLKD